MNRTNCDAHLKVRHYPCKLPAGHEGAHEAPDGRRWRTDTGSSLQAEVERLRGAAWDALWHYHYTHDDESLTIPKLSDCTNPTCKRMAGALDGPS